MAGREGVLIFSLHFDSKKNRNPGWPATSVSLRPTPALDALGHIKIAAV